MKRLIIPCVVGACLLISCNGKKAQEQQEQTDSTVSHQNIIPSILPHGSIVYVEIDSLMENYLMTIDLMGEFEEKANRLQTDLANRERRFQDNVRDFQNRAERRLETMTRLQEMEQQLSNERDNLMRLSESYQMEMAEEQGVMQRQIIQAIQDFLNEYNHDKRYQFILANSFGGNILYADPSLNITAPVLEGLNAKYRTERR